MRDLAQKMGRTDQPTYDDEGTYVDWSMFMLLRSTIKKVLKEKGCFTFEDVWNALKGRKWFKDKSLEDIVKMISYVRSASFIWSNSSFS